MSDRFESGVLYTEYSPPTERTLIASLWSYQTRSREQARASITRTPEGSQEYWLEWSDPLLNTLVPGTGVSLVVNFGDVWRAGLSLSTSVVLPRVCVVGPVTYARILRVGKIVDAIGAGFSATLTPNIFGIEASELVDRILPLEDLWPSDAVERLVALLHCVGTGSIARISVLRTNLLARVRGNTSDPIAQTATRLILHHHGRVAVDAMATSHHLSRQQFSRRFRAAAGLSPKVFARITRFQALLHSLLSTDVSQWAGLAVEMGFYDQAHMINEFRTFAGSAPTLFFKPHDSSIDPAEIRLNGRPSEWLRVRFGHSDEPERNG